MKKAKKHVPLHPSQGFNRRSYIILVSVVTLVCVLVFIMKPNSFGVEQEYFSNSIRFLRFSEDNGTFYAHLKIYVNESKDCAVRALYMNKTDMQIFKCHEGIQEVILPLNGMPIGKTKVEFFLNCSLNNS